MALTFNDALGEPGTPTGQLCACGCGDETVYGHRGAINRFIVNHQRIRRHFYDVDEGTGCWVSCKTPDKRGYIQDTTYSSLHVRAYVEHHGPVPDGHVVHHKCRNRACVNPAHLEPLVQKEHLRIKGHGHTKLSYEDVAEIRRRVAGGEVKRRIAESFDIAPSTLSAILSGKSWS